MRRIGVMLVWLAALVAPACASKPPTPARVRLELLQSAALMSTLTRPRVDILLDVTRSMGAQSNAGPEHQAAARRAAQRLVGALPAGTQVRLHGLGMQEEACGTASRVAEAEVARGDGVLLEQIEAMRSRGEASLAAALLGMLETREVLDEARRVVAFTDLGSECGGDLCAVAPRFAARGVRLDLVVIGDAEVPACLLERLDLPDTAPPAGIAPIRSVRFHVETELAPGIPLVSCGEAGAGPLTLPPGRGVLTVELDPPLRLERNFSPGIDLVLQLVDFPAADPPVRRWRWQAMPEAAGAGETDGG
ncbi:MAG: hypothetical protein OEM49_01255 [Myxococcales bacterium]|nr:hypothetical protein [Myxococcales bacterium]MDH5306752.1 hypothetical protein [Myxococcales bacterium]MDH5567063.1 hypothetical protein [Myxococcales bacterium]